MPVDRYQNTTPYVHPAESNLLNVHRAMEYDLAGRPVLRTLLNTTTVQITGPVSILSTVTVNSTSTDPVHVHITEIGTSGLLNVPYMPIGGNVTATIVDCVSVQNCGDTALLVTGTVNVKVLNDVLTTALFLGEEYVSGTNPLPVSLGDVCISIENCTGTRLNVNSNAIILINELPVADNNPFPVNVTNNCISVQNCGPDGVLNVSGAITVEGVEVTVETPFPVDLRNECLSVQNCSGTQLSVKLSDGVNNIGFVVNDNDGQSPGTYSVPVENFNMIWNGAGWDRMPGNALSGVAVNITNSCLSVANCADSVLAIAGDVNVQIGGVDVSADNPVPVTIPNCVSIQNCGESTLGINGTVGLEYDGQVVNESHPLPVTGTVNATINGEVSVATANPDAFGRARVSELFTLGDYKHLYALDPNFIDATENGGSITFDPNQAMAVLATSSATNSVAIHQTKFYHHYQPGKSQLIYSSFHFREPHRNVTKRTGYFDDRDGIYFEQVGSNTADGSTVNTSTQTLNWVIRSYTTGSPDESNFVTTVNGLPYTYKRRVPQSEWNVDPCDGTGPSGFNLDVTKTQLCWIDFQWLGVGRVRCGFVHNGELITAHEYYHSNVLPVVYMANPNLPVRCEIRNTGTTPGGAMDQVCASVMSEGGYVESGIDWSIYTTERTLPTPGRTRFPLVAIRLKNSFQGYPNRLSVRPLSLSLFAKTEPIVYEVCKLPNAGSLSTTAPGGLVWTSADADSGVEYCTNATGFTSADVDRFASGYVPAGSSQNSLSPVATGSLTAAKKNVICQNIDSTNSEVYVVIVSTIFSGVQLTADVACAIQWREIY